MNTHTHTHTHTHTPALSIFGIIEMRNHCVGFRDTSVFVLLYQ